MPEFRWNQAEMAAGYDAGAALIHPYYVELQDVILERLPLKEDREELIVDLGGGSGRLVERVLDRWPRVTAVIIDQSQAFLNLAAARLKRFGSRATLVCRRLQEEWRDVVPQPAAAAISMSAIHHLDPDEKKLCYARCFEILRPGGMLLNGDEVRATTDAEYRRQVETWAAHMDRLIAESAVTGAMAEGLRRWRQRNVDQFGEPRVSGDDCHETAAAQLACLHQAGFTGAVAVWTRELWTVLSGTRPE